MFHQLSSALWATIPAVVLYAIAGASAVPFDEGVSNDLESRMVAPMIASSTRLHYGALKGLCTRTSCKAVLAIAGSQLRWPV